uniref:Vitellogenin domain-containing protein n=1 Tax=Trichobilharzia regenti TaxID=157069 RepID=A0AA85KLW8_TRIRE|nr:unnamed protein product [Trichobilharzia regenti]
MFSMTKIWQLCFTNILLLLFSFHISQLEGETFTYEYTVNISENSYKQVVLDVLSGKVYITPIILNEFSEKVDAINKSLWYVTLNIDTQTYTEEITLNSLVLFNPNGLIDRIFISRSTLKKGIIEINLFKGLLSLFNVNNKFEPGIEIDSSGKCQVTYATTTATPSDKPRTTPASADIIIIDKEKTLCERLQKPIDVWNENSLTLFNFKESRQILTRYKYDKLTHQILEVYAYENQIHGFSDDLSEANYKEYQQLINSTGVNFISWQELKFIEETIHQDDRIQKIVEKHYDFTLDEVTEILFGSDYQTIHLGLVYPISKSQTCGLNLNLFTAFHTDSDEGDSGNQKGDANLFILRQHIESYRDHLQTDAIGSIQSTEALLNLTNLLRCLSTSNASISALTSATMLAPPAIEPQLIYRQINTWRDRLIDILISCGTDTCLTIVLNRLTALSQFIYSNKGDEDGEGIENYDDQSLEIIKSKEMLYTKLWPSLSHLRKLTSVHQMDHLYTLCEKSILIDDNYVCLMTLINLLEHNTIAYDVRPIIQHIQKLLDITEFSVKNDASMKRNKLLIGLAMSKKLRHPALTRSLFKIILDNSEKHIPVVLQTLAIRVIGEIHFSNEAKNRLKSYSSIPDNDHDHPHLDQHQQLTEIRTRLIDVLYKLPKESQNDLLIGQEIFKVLLLSELPVASLAQILSDMAQQSRWSLIGICRQLIQQWCKMGMLSIDECQCLGWRRSTSTTCQLGLSGSWSGLTGKGGEDTGQATLLHNEISNLNNTLLIDYTSYFVLDPSGGLQLSDLSVSLVSKDGETVIFDFSIQADKLTTLGGTSSSKGKDTTTTSSSNSDGDAWLTVDFSYLGISLLPQEVFSGGALDIVKFLWSASSSRLTPLLQVLKLPIDQRIQVSITSGWIVQIDNLVGMALSISNSLETSVWRLSGKSLARTQIGLMNEMKINLLQSYPSPSQQQHQEQSTNLQLHHSLITKGFALQGNIDFTTEIDIKHLPESICMTMDQGANAYVLQWYLTNYSSVSSSSSASSYNTSPPSVTQVNTTHHRRDYHDKDVYYMLNYTLQPVTYFLDRICSSLD